mmetsp:Transcript_59437/g.106040  ORF Transcript_59437/g.106040 Transcript_59437/m.106040 type:complete len:103 (+) Transcript_59437:132-440(+)
MPAEEQQSDTIRLTRSDPAASGRILLLSDLFLRSVSDVPSSSELRRGWGGRDKGRCILILEGQLQSEDLLLIVPGGHETAWLFVNFLIGYFERDRLIWFRGK